MRALVLTAAMLVILISSGATALNTKLGICGR
jgi:hypothetical protein